MGKTYFNPGFALSIYKSDMGEKILAFLNKNYGEVSLHKICCRHNPKLDYDSVIINASKYTGSRGFSEA